MGTEGCHTMKIMGKIKRQPLIMLVDSGSTHNFMDQAVARRLKCPTRVITGIKVTVANGDVLKSQEVCESIMWEAQGLTQFTDFMVLPLMGCDLVLGVQWLKTLGPIMWDFNKLSMQFSIQGQDVKWSGLQGGTVQYASKGQFSKLTASVHKGTCTLLLIGTPTLQSMTCTSQPSLDEISCIELQELLQQFSALFDEPFGLPPKRRHDHSIPLKDEGQVVKLRPYRYPTVQKNEIEKLVTEMKAAGIIRDSTSPFASPVVLVKKKDGT